MNVAERAIWKRLVPDLAESGVLAKVDVEAMARYCTIAAWWYECREFLNDNGKTYEVTDVTVNTTSGETREFVKGIKVRPEAKLAVEYWSELRRLEQEFGLTSASRTRLCVPPKMGTQTVSSRPRNVG